MLSDKYAPKYNITYVPTMGPGWDASPRTLPSDAWGEWGYPWGASWHSTPEQWVAALKRARSFGRGRCDSVRDAVGGWTCPPLIISAWNEWSEGSYLEPDERYGWQKLEAVGDVLGRSGSK